jgi:hypothetical protein
LAIAVQDASRKRIVDDVTADITNHAICEASKGSHYTSHFMNGNKPIPPSKDDELPGEPNNTSTATVIDSLTSTDNPITTGYMTTEDSTTTTTTKTRNKVLLQTAVRMRKGRMAPIQYRFDYFWIAVANVPTLPIH